MELRHQGRASMRFCAGASAATSSPRSRLPRLRPGAERICLARPGRLGPQAMPRRIVSSPGKKDGLYWPTAEGEEPSPFGDLAAQASAEGYKAGEKPIPYHGYYYRILKRQGRAPPGGAYDYVVKRQDDRRLRADRLPRPIRQFRHHDLHGQSGRHGVSKGSRASAPRRSRAKIETFEPDAKLDRRSTCSLKASIKR